MRIVRASSQPVFVWKNGGGTTREIARVPIDSSLDSFDWRVSRAHVATDGPFSTFAGVDRTLTVLTGKGIRLDVEGQGEVTLTAGSAPFSFAGDVAVGATLADGPLDDLNVMTRRDRCRHEVRRQSLVGATTFAPRGDTVLLYVVAGELVVGGDTLGPGDAVVEDERRGLTLDARSSTSALVVDLWYGR